MDGVVKDFGWMLLIFGAVAFVGALLVQLPAAPWLFVADLLLLAALKGWFPI